MRRCKMVMCGLLMLFMVSFFTACSETYHAGHGLDLYAVASLVKRAENAEQLEEMVNAQDINNLDLNGDGYVDNMDHINVREYGSGHFRGFSLSVLMSDGSIQQVAEMHFEQAPNGAIVLEVRGNPQMYGPNYIIRSQITAGMHVPFVVWAFIPRPVYVSRYVDTPPPSTVVIRREVIPIKQYRVITRHVVKEVQMPVEKVTKPIVTTTAQSPNEGKTSAVVKAPLAAPTQTQREFQARPENKPLAVGGFKRENPGKATAPPSQPTKSMTAPPAMTPAHKDTLAVPKGTVKQFDARDQNKEIQTGGFKRDEPTKPPPHTPEKTITTPAAQHRSTPVGTPSAPPTAPKSTGSTATGTKEKK